MPFVRISLKTPVAPSRRREIADAIHAGLCSSIGIPAEDRFQVIETLGADMIVDPNYLGVSRDDGVVFVEVHLVRGRSLDKKRALYRDIAENLEKVGVERRNVLIHLVENAFEDWSFGEGVAQYAERPPVHV